MTDERPDDDSAQFQGLILSLAAAALHQLGGDPEAKRAPDPAQARQAIDLLEVLQRKTQGNLTAEERDLFESVLFDLRMRFLHRDKRAPGAV